MKVSVFITCLADQIYPQVGVAMVRLLRRYGCDVDFPASQTCCGQPAFNSGYPDAARDVARNQIKAFANSEYVVTPSGSCAGMIHHYYPELFADDPTLKKSAQALIDKTYEFSQFMVNILGVEDVGATFPHRVTFHPSCHGSRLLGAKTEPLQLLSKVREMEVIPLVKAEDCCGFGGAFAAKMSDMSGAMVGEKVDHIVETGAEYLVGTDMGCLMNIVGQMNRRGIPVKALHIAELLHQGSSTPLETSKS